MAALLKHVNLTVVDGERDIGRDEFFATANQEEKIVAWVYAQLWVYNLTLVAHIGFSRGM